MNSFGDCFNTTAGFYFIRIFFFFSHPGKRMKATYHREGLLSAVQLASVAVAARDLKPILQNIKVITEDDRSTLMATDLELGIRLDVRGVKVEETGQGILPAARLTAILRESTDEELHLDADNDRCIITGQYNEF